MSSANTVVPVLTGVIYGAIVVAWAVYLVPLALRRHDEASRTRSIERFSSAMRILARRGSTGGQGVQADSRVVVTPKRSEPRVVSPDPAPEPERVLVPRARSLGAQRRAAARRRRVLSLLMLLTLVTAVASLIGLLPIWSLALPVAMLVGFLVVARLSVRRAAQPHWVEAPALEQSSAVVVRRSPARVDASLDADGGAEQGADDEPTITLTEAQRAAAAQNWRAAAPVSTQTPDGGSLWDPLPVTLPTYVAAPVAVRAVRTIELGQPGVWSSGRSAGTTPGVASGTRPAEVAAEVDADVQAVDDDEVTEEVPQVVNG